MGIFKIFFMAAVPALTMTVLAFRLGPKLPGAARLFGNQIGLGYVYFKCALKYLKPNDQTAY